MFLLYSLRTLIFSVTLLVGISINFAHAGNDSIAGLLTINVDLGGVSSGEFVTGHAWIEFRPIDNIQHVTTVGTWNEGIMPYPEHLPTRRGINLNYELGRTANASRSSYITVQQLERGVREIVRYMNLEENDAWSYSKNCSVSASDIWFAATGEIISPKSTDSFTEYWYIPSAPLYLFYSIHEINGNKLYKLSNPHKVGGQ